MLQDRDYMKRDRPPREPQDRVASGMRTLYTLIGINAVLFLMFSGARVNPFALNVDSFLGGAWYQPLTAMFMHEGFGHVFFNMFALYVFGSLAAPILGGPRFLALYLGSGVFGNLLWLVCFFHNPGWYLLGASGAVMGVTLAAAMMRPEVEMLVLFIPFPMKLRTLVLVFIGIDLFSEMTGAFGMNVAYLAHIGGFIAGYLIMILFQRREVVWNPLSFLSGGNAGAKTNSMPRGWHMSSGDYRQSQRDDAAGRTSSPGPVSQGELDFLLDKISRQGINSLSEAEMDRLRQAREQMRGGRD